MFYALHTLDFKQGPAPYASIVTEGGSKEGERFLSGVKVDISDCKSETFLPEFD